MSVTAEDRRVARGCPRWCALDHSGSDVALLHESGAHTLAISHRHETAVPESVDVRVVQYEPDEPAEPGRPGVELAYHVGSRYRVISLSAHEARVLAQMLLDGAARAAE